ncbi:MAG: right-handed parallel beta-helix repeat-containing protein, partial [Blastocatellia bacterium]
MKSGSKTRQTIKWVFFFTLLIQCFSQGSNRFFSFFAGVTGTNGRASAAVAAATPELPRVILDTNYTPPVGRIITVNAGGDLQAAINQALPGDIINLQAGATFTGNFTLPNKTGSGWIVIRSSTPDSSLPPQGTRIAPQNAGLLPKILTPDTAAAIMTAAGAHNYRLLGLEIGIQAGVALNYGIVRLGDGSSAQNSLSQVPQDIIIDRCYIHGNSTGDVSRGIGLNSGRTAIIDSFISECHAVGSDTQAICGWNGPGAYKIVNNYLEGAGENFMLGGADPSITGLIPSDIEFRDNYVYKPLRWKTGEPSYAGIHWSVKNLFELKNAQRLLIDGNIFENSWGDAQDGFAVVLKSVNQDGGAPWSHTGDVTFTNNIIRHSGAGINLLGRDSNQLGVQMQRVLIRNNLLDDINGPRWGGTHGRALQISDVPDVIVDHNTVIQTGDAITTYGLPSSNFVYTNNIVAHNLYGVKGDSAASGNGTINTYLPGAIFTRNILAGGDATYYPAGNFFPSALTAVGFVNFTGGDYRLSSTSPYRNAGTDGQDLGYLLGQTTPTPTPTPSPTPALAITNVIATSITNSSATITWTTNQFANSQVEYGTTTAYGQQTTLNTTLLTAHVEVVIGLATDTVYNFRVKSQTSGG